MTTKADRPWLTLLRFFLAAWVVGFHQSSHTGMLRSVPPSLLSNVLAHGYVAVTVFFVLSGFVLALSSRSATRVDIRDFYWRRFVRIYPTYTVGLVIAAPIVIYQVMHGLVSVRSAGLSFVLSLLLLQSFSASLNSIWNPPGWSLSVEAVFYFAFPFLIWRIASLRYRGLVLFLLACVVCAAGLNLIAFAVPALAWFDTFPFARMTEFAAGIALCFVLEDGKKNARRMAWPVLLAGIVALMLVPPSMPLWGLVVPLAVAVVGLLSAMPAGLPKVLVVLGESSYAVYIIHSPVATYWLRGCREFGFADSGFGCFFSYFVFVQLFALLVNWVAERKVRRWLLSFSAKKS